MFCTQIFFVQVRILSVKVLFMSIEPYRTFITELALESGDLIRPYFGKAGLEVELKSDASPVTVADRKAEELLRKRIESRFPDHGIIGEEFGNVREDAEWVWVLDPIDGTKAFMTAVPLFGTLIALLHKGQPVLGVIHQPILKQLMLGDGHTTTLNGERVRVRDCSRIEDAIFVTSDPHFPAKYQDGAAFEAVSKRARVSRTWGDCYGYLLLASGWADISVDPIMNPWDIHALIPIVRGAGGLITDWQGNDPVTANSIAAAGPGLHSQVIAALNPSRG